MPSLSDFPTAVDSYTADEDGVTTIHADDVNEARDFAIAAQTKLGTDADALSASTLEGRAKYQEAGGLKRGSSVASATAITLADTAQVFPITGTATIATIAAPPYPRLVYLECASALTLTHGSGNLTLPGAADLAVAAGAVLALEWTGSTWQVVGAGTGTLSNPLTTLDDVIVGAASGVPARLAVGGDGQVLTVDPATHHVAWANSASGFSNPMVAQDDVMIGGTAGTATRLAKGTDGQVLTVDPATHHLLWATPTALTNPMTTAEDVIVGGVSGTPARLAKGGDGQVLTVNPTTHAVGWANSASGFANPMAAQDDLIVGGSAGTGTRLAKGSDAQVLTVSPSTHHLVWRTIPTFGVGQDGLVTGPGSLVAGQFLASSGAWATPTGFSNPMTTTGDLIKGGSSGTPGRLAIGSTGDVLTVVAGAPAWAAPAGGGGSSADMLWDPYGLAVPPVATALSVHDNWAGSGIVTALDQLGDALVFKNPGAGSTVERGAFGTTSGPLAVPAPPYTATICFIPNIYPINFWTCALALRQSSNDKRIVARVVYDTGVIKIDGVNWTDYQNVSSAFGSQAWPLTFPIWLRIRDDGGSRYWEVCKEGKWFVAYTSGSSGAFCTPDQAGIAMDSSGGGSGSVASMTVLSLSVVNTA